MRSAPDEAIPLDENYPRLSDIDRPGDSFKNKKDYEKQLQFWQRRLLHVQQAYFHEKRRAIIAFEGADASGKGGSIRRVAELLDPRGIKVHAIAAPKAEEQSRHYLYRFFSRLPASGEFAIFDRTWYGRVLVERIEGFAKEQEWQRAYREIREFERWLEDDGVRIIKFYLHIDEDEQLKRFDERLNNPYKHWKLTEEDLRNRDKWHDYSEAVDEMFAKTSTEKSPWHLINSNRKWHARVEVLKTLVLSLEEGVDVSPRKPDPKLIAEAEKALGIDYNQG